MEGKGELLLMRLQADECATRKRDAYSTLAQPYERPGQIHEVPHLPYITDSIPERSPRTYYLPTM